MDKEKVTVGAPKVTGAIFIGKKGTQLPKDGTEELHGDFKCLGYASDDGITISEEKDNDEKTAWGGDIVRTTVKKFYEKMNFTPIETNDVVLKATYGDDNVEIKNDAKGNQVIISKHTGVDLPILPLIIETVAAKNIIKRYVAPCAQLTERGDINLKDDDFDGREMTYTLMKDENGITLYEYTTFLKEQAK